MKIFKIEIASVPDRNNLVAELWFGENLIAEINNENIDFEIEFYFSETNSFKLDELLKAIEFAKNKLLDNLGNVSN